MGAGGLGWRGVAISRLAVTWHSSAPSLSTNSVYKILQTNITSDREEFKFSAALFQPMCSFTVLF